jgi:hydroxymethylpyrimidine/phosphomethylpyrimidine kinase
MVAASGDRLVSDETVDAVRTRLLPLATIITPNLPETATLLGWDADWRAATPERMAEAGADLLKLGANAAVVKGGHAGGEESNDVLVGDGYVDVLRAPRVVTSNSHGTGCTFASAIAAYVLRGMPLRDAVAEAKTYLTGALRAADTLRIGDGHGPVQHFANRPPQTRPWTRWDRR